MPRDKYTKASEWIHDFVHSDNPRFKGKNKKTRIKMALAAYYTHEHKKVKRKKKLRKQAKEAKMKKKPAKKKKSLKEAVLLELSPGAGKDYPVRVKMAVHQKDGNVSKSDYANEPDGVLHAGSLQGALWQTKSHLERMHNSIINIDKQKFRQTMDNAHHIHYQSQVQDHDGSWHDGHEHHVYPGQKHEEMAAMPVNNAAGGQIAGLDTNPPGKIKKKRNKRLRDVVGSVRIG